MTTDAILSAAAHILETEGFAAFNTNAVAERAGVSIGSLYQYFPNKDAILVALIELRAASFADALAEVADNARGTGFTDDLRTLLEHALAWRDRKPKLNSVLDQQELRLEAYLDLQSAKMRLHETIAALLRRRSSAVRRPEDLAAASRDIVVIIRALMEADWRQEEQDWSRAIDRTLGAVMGYLAVDAS